MEVAECALIEFLPYVEWNELCFLYFSIVVIYFEYYFLRPHLDLETDYGVGGIRHRGFYSEAVGLFLDSYLPAVGQACNGFHLAAVQALDSEGLAVPTENEGVNEAVLTGETDIPFDGSLIGACAIDAFPVFLQPFADFQQYLLLIFGDGAVALGRNIQTEVTTAGYVIDETPASSGRMACAVHGSHARSQ